MKPIQRVLALTLVLVFMVPVSYLAAQWQLQRHTEREALNSLLQTARDKPPVQLGSVAKNPAEYTQVIVEGKPEGEQALWRRQVLNGIPGYIALQNVTLADGNSITIALGWTQSPDNVYLKSDISFPITGYVRYPQSSGTSPADVPASQVNYVSELMASTNYDFYVQGKGAPENLSRLVLPETQSGPHLGYVGQWILIGIASVVIYVIALRRIRSDYASDIKS